MDEAVVEARFQNRRGLTLSVTIDGEHVVIRVQGELDVANADLLLPAAIGAIARDASLRLDLAEVTFLDVGALQRAASHIPDSMTSLQTPV